MAKLIKKHIKKVSAIFVLICIFMVSANIFALNVYAAGSVSVKVSSSSVLAGGDFNVTITMSSGNDAMAGGVVEITYDSSIVRFVSGDDAGVGNDGVLRIAVWNTNAYTQAKSFTRVLKFKAVKAGSATIRANASLDLESGTELKNITGSASVTVRNVSNNAELKSLTVSAGTLSPKFTSETLSYKINLPASAKSVKISASANNAHATVAGTGTFNLKAGEKRTFNVVVTAEDKSTKKTYKIEVTVEQATPRPSTPTPTPGPTSAAVGTPTQQTEQIETSPPESTQAQTSPLESTQTQTQEATIPPTQTPTEIKGIFPEDDVEGDFFSTKTAFLICGAGMFVSGISVGYTVCHVVNNRNKANKGKEINSEDI